MMVSSSKWRVVYSNLAILINEYIFGRETSMDNFMVVHSLYVTDHNTQSIYDLFLLLFVYWMLFLMIVILLMVCKRVIVLCLFPCISLITMILIDIIWIFIFIPILIAIHIHNLLL